MARPSRNISVLDGGESVCAATDIISPLGLGPLRLGSRPLFQLSRRNPGRIVPQRNIVTQKAKEAILVLQAGQITLGITKCVDVIN
jgi:hypothetical protein